MQKGSTDWSADVLLLDQLWVTQLVLRGWLAVGFQILLLHPRQSRCIRMPTVRSRMNRYRKPRCNLKLSQTALKAMTKQRRRHPCRPSTVPTLSHTRIPRRPRRVLPPIRQKKDSPQGDPKRRYRNKVHLTKQRRHHVSRRRHCNVTERCRKK